MLLHLLLMDIVVVHDVMWNHMYMDVRESLGPDVMAIYLSPEAFPQP